MNAHMLLQIAVEFRERAAVAVSDEDRTELLYLAEEYEAVACADLPHKIHPFSVKIPK